MGLWYTEAMHEGVAQSVEIDRMIHTRRTRFQEVSVFETRAFGRVMVLDGILQTTEKDEYFYHEMLTHVPIMAHGAVENVLIIGGGDGGALRRVLQHPVQHVTLVDLDAEVVEIARDHLPEIHQGAFEDGRAELIFGDGTAYVAETERQFDVIIIDSTDPAGPGEVLFDTPFYQDCQRKLKAGGIVVGQTGNAFMEPAQFSTIFGRLQSVFSDVTCTIGAVPSYYGGYMTYLWASDDPAPRQIAEEELQQRWKAANISAKWYSPAMHRAAFALPPSIECLIRGCF